MQSLFRAIVSFLLLFMILSQSPAWGQTELLAKFRQIHSDFKNSSKSEQKKTLNKLNEAIDKTQDENEKKLLLMAHALLSTDQGEVVVAEEDYKKLLQTPSDLQEYAIFFYGELLMDQKRYEEAQKQFEGITHLSPNAKLEMDSQFHMALIAIEEKKIFSGRSFLEQTGAPAKA